MLDPERYLDHNVRAGARARFDRARPAEQRGSLAHADQAQATVAGGGSIPWLEPDPVILHDRGEGTVVLDDHDAGAFRVRVASDIRQRCLMAFSLVK